VRYAVDPMDRLDSGERAAIHLAIDMKADLVLMDDRQGRIAAVASGLVVRGTVGVLLQAANDGMIDLRAALDALAATNFHITQFQIEEALASVRKTSS
jgi:predicted nucleic acid-binding protein